MAPCVGWLLGDGTWGLPEKGRVFKQCDNIGHIGCFSFFSNKNLTTSMLSWRP
jgi:hypothetical protein